jgi:hypothetical protein
MLGGEVSAIAREGAAEHPAPPVGAGYLAERPAPPGGAGCCAAGVGAAWIGNLSTPAPYRPTFVTLAP